MLRERVPAVPHVSPLSKIERYRSLTVVPGSVHRAHEIACTSAETAYIIDSARSKKTRRWEGPADGIRKPL